MNLQKYAYKPYDAIFSTLFELEEIRLKQQLASNIKIDHFGSTAVPNLGGKGIIDIFMTTSKDNVQSTAKILQATLGYAYRPLGGDERRLFFRRQQHDNSGVLRTYHLHLTDTDNPNYIQAVTLRDYLRLFPEEAKRYAAVKQHASKLAMQCTDYEQQKKTYQRSKSHVLTELTTKSLGWFNVNRRKFN